MKCIAGDDIGLVWFFCFFFLLLHHFRRSGTILFIISPFPYLQAHFWYLFVVTLCMRCANVCLPKSIWYRLSFSIIKWDEVKWGRKKYSIKGTYYIFPTHIYIYINSCIQKTSGCKSHEYLHIHPVQLFTIKCSSTEKMTTNAWHLMYDDDELIFCYLNNWKGCVHPMSFQHDV